MWYFLVSPMQDTTIREALIQLQLPSPAQSTLKTTRSYAGDRTKQPNLSCWPQRNVDTVGFSCCGCWRSRGSKRRAPAAAWYSLPGPGAGETPLPGGDVTIRTSSSAEQSPGDAGTTLGPPAQPGRAHAMLGPRWDHGHSRAEPRRCWDHAGTTGAAGQSPGDAGTILGPRAQPGRSEGMPGRAVLLPQAEPRAARLCSGGCWGSRPGRSAHLVAAHRGKGGGYGK